jgi:hypothetical protein
VVATRGAAWTLREFIDASAPLGWSVQTFFSVPSRLRLGPAQSVARAPWSGATAAPINRPAFRPAQRLAALKAARLGSGAALSIKRRAPIGRPIRGNAT